MARGLGRTLGRTLSLALAAPLVLGACVVEEEGAGDGDGEDSNVDDDSGDDSGDDSDRAPWIYACDDALAELPSALEWTVQGHWNSPPILHAMPDGGVVVVGEPIVDEGPDEGVLPPLSVRVFGPDGDERWSDEYEGYEGYTPRSHGLRVDADGNVTVAVLDVYARVIYDPDGGGDRELGEETLISWAPDGTRRFRSQTTPCGDSPKGGLGRGEDGMLRTVWGFGEFDPRLCVHRLSPVGGPEGESTIIEMPDEGESLYFPRVQWDGSVLVTGVSGGESFLGRYDEDGASVWSERTPSESFDFAYLEPGQLVSLTVVTSRGGGTPDEVRAHDEAGDPVWSALGFAYGASCSGDVVTAHPDGGLALLDAASGMELARFDSPVDTEEESLQAFAPSPDGALYTTTFTSEGYELLRVGSGD